MVFCLEGLEEEECDGLVRGYVFFLVVVIGGRSAGIQEGCWITCLVVRVEYRLCSGMTKHELDSYYEVLSTPDHLL